MQTEDYIERQEKKGERILKLLVIANVTFFVAVLVMSLLNGISQNIIGLIIMLFLCVFIYFGGQIAKWIYIIINTINVFNLLYALFAGAIISTASLLLNVVTIIMIILSIVTSIILILSSSVKEFMYKQQY